EFILLAAAGVEFVEIDGTTLVQTRAILNYIATYAEGIADLNE
uniref:Glutathione transferase class alpha A2 (Fragments) n=1 Tax=Mesocricetus auratus TaxID=10036 RepID=Q7M0F6_MESAU